MSEMTMDHHQVSREEELRSIDNQKFAMWLYLASEVIIFSIFIAAYALFRLHESAEVREFHNEIGVTLVSFNTFLLLMSSWAMVMGLREIRRNNVQGLIRWLGGTALLGTAFVALQYVEYQELAHLGVTLPYINDDFSGLGMHFYAPTAFHGAHVIAGVLWCLLVIWRARKGRYSARNYVGVEVFGLYWHFVDVVWIILFTLIYLI